MLLLVHSRDTHLSVNSVAFSPDGKQIVSGSSDNSIRVWDAVSGDVVVGPLKGHTDSVWSVAFSPDGKQIVSGSYDNSIQVWDAVSGDVVVGPLKGHTDSVYSVAFSPDGKQIVSGSSDNSIRVWDAVSGDVVVGPLKGHTDSVLSVAFSPDGKQIVSGSSRQLHSSVGCCEWRCCCWPTQGTHIFSLVCGLLTRWQADCVRVIRQLHSSVGCCEWRCCCWPTQGTHIFSLVCGLLTRWQADCVRVIRQLHSSVGPICRLKLTLVTLNMVTYGSNVNLSNNPLRLSCVSTYIHNIAFMYITVYASHIYGCYYAHLIKHSRDTIV
jgi:WD40 repeat protein